MPRGVRSARSTTRSTIGIEFPNVDDDTLLVRIESAMGDRRFKAFDAGCNIVMCKLRGSLRRAWVKPMDLVLAVRRTELSSDWFDIIARYSDTDQRALKRAGYTLPPDKLEKHGVDNNDDDDIVFEESEFFMIAQNDGTMD